MNRMQVIRIRGWNDGKDDSIPFACFRVCCYVRLAGECHGLDCGEKRLLQNISVIFGMFHQPDRAPSYGH